MQYNVYFEQEKIFKDCVNPKTNTYLRFDFYLPDYNCCIEYDGEQHFHIPKNKTSTFFTDKEIKNIQYRDSIKNQYCLQNQITLIRIPYSQYNNIEQILLEQLNLAAQERSYDN